jgi:hypothetical protein
MDDELGAWSRNPPGEPLPWSLQEPAWRVLVYHLLPLELVFALRGANQFFRALSESPPVRTRLLRPSLGSPPSSVTSVECWALVARCLGDQDMGPVAGSGPVNLTGSVRATGALQLPAAQNSRSERESRRKDKIAAESPTACNLLPAMLKVLCSDNESLGCLLLRFRLSWPLRRPYQWMRVVAVCSPLTVTVAYDVVQGGFAPAIC